MTMDWTVVQKTLIDTLVMGGKSQAIFAVCRVMFKGIFMES